MEKNRQLALDQLGINVNKLGCVMLDVEPVDLTGFPTQWEYFARNPEHRWITGAQRADVQHITLLYGLLQNANVIKPQVDLVLEGWNPGWLGIGYTEVFESNYDDEEYSCIVGRIGYPGEQPVTLLDAHIRLSTLPHIDTFWDYKPHVTLAYVHKQYTDEAMNWLQKRVSVGSLTPIGLNYGYKP